LHPGGDAVIRIEPAFAGDDETVFSNLSSQLPAILIPDQLPANEN